MIELFGWCAAPSSTEGRGAEGNLGRVRGRVRLATKGHLLCRSRIGRGRKPMTV